jgi:hypothetical protein
MKNANLLFVPIPCPILALFSNVWHKTNRFDTGNEGFQGETPTNASSWQISIWSNYIVDLKKGDRKEKMDDE